MKFPFINQLGARDCGAACLTMIAHHYGQKYALNYVREKCNVTKVGVSLLGISKAAETIGLKCVGKKMNVEQLKETVQEGPAILHWNENHFVVVYKLPKRNRGGTFYLADPGVGLITYKEDEFIEKWIGKHLENVAFSSDENKNANQKVGYALLLEPTTSFYKKPQAEGLQKNSVNKLWKYFSPHKKIFAKLVATMLVSSAIMLTAPYLTQAMVDNGINLHHLNFIYVILLAQLLLFAGSSLADVVRNHLLLHMGSRINIAMVSSFLTKLLKLPVLFFDKHITGDLMQRINDHHRIENLLTLSSLSSVFSVLSVVLLSIVLAVYSIPVFIIFIAGSLFGFLWILFFLNKRRKIDFTLFDLYSKENSKVIEMITGIKDIKISNSIQHKKQEWHSVKSALYQLKIQSLRITQLQNTGSALFKQITSIFITFMAAKGVIDGHLSLGTMFAITMIIGQLSSPIEQLHDLVTSWQDAKMGWERIDDVLIQKEEDPEDQVLLHEIPTEEDILLQNVSFGYGIDQEDLILKDVCLTIPSGKITAIVGSSGSGKTTLMKLLIRFYDPTNGSISLNELDFRNFHHSAWREKCGVVMQDGQLFSGTIADNIAMGNEKNYGAIVKAAQIASIHEFVDALPKGYLTEIGMEGMTLSTGQTQRILLARAVYKNPSYLFLDEATSSLDANTEKNVIENLIDYFQGRTVVVIAHRLSTVKNADQLIVLDKGKIVETGSHEQLTKKKGAYYKLVKNQLELSEL